MEIAEDFIKMLTIAVAIVGILAIFFVFIQYNIIINYEDDYRKALVLGDALLASKCLAEVDENGYIIKGLFLESKLNDIVGNPECIHYDKGKFSVKMIDESKVWEDISISQGLLGGGETTYVVSVKFDETGNNEVRLANMVVMV